MGRKFTLKLKNQKSGKITEETTEFRYSKWDIRNAWPHCDIKMKTIRDEEIVVEYRFYHDDELIATLTPIVPHRKRTESERRNHKLVMQIREQYQTYMVMVLGPPNAEEAKRLPRYTITKYVDGRGLDDIYEGTKESCKKEAERLRKLGWEYVRVMKLTRK